MLEEGLDLHRNRGQLRQRQPGCLLKIGEKKTDEKKTAHGMARQKMQTILQRLVH